MVVLTAGRATYLIDLASVQSMPDVSDDGSSNVELRHSLENIVVDCFMRAQESVANSYEEDDAMRQFLALPPMSEDELFLASENAEPRARPPQYLRRNSP